MSRNGIWKQMWSSSGSAVLARLGGRVEPSDDREYGRAILKTERPDPLFEHLPGDERTVWMSHGDTVLGLPPGFEVLASTANSPYAAVRHRERRIWGVQFHPEVAHTEGGSQLLQNFLRICGCEASWTMESFIDETVEQIRQQVGDKKVICGLSGGVDSSVAAALETPPGSRRPSPQLRLSTSAHERGTRRASRRSRRPRASA